MMRILQTDGTLIEVPAAISAEVMGKEVVCYDRKGVIVARYPSSQVTIFGSHLPASAVLTDTDGDKPAT
jgi:hypothetical protein